MFTAQSYICPSSLEEAWQLNQKKRNRILGGMLWMKCSNGSYGTLIDLSHLLSDTIEETADAFLIGAMTPLRALEQHPGLNAYSQHAIRHALEHIVGVQFRNMATVGGSLWGRFGFSDVLTILLAMDCQVELYKGGCMSLEAFASMKRDNDILMRLIIKKTPGYFAYEAMRAQSTDFPVLTSAVSCVNGSIKAAVGARPAKALVISDTSGLLAEGLTDDRIQAFADYVCDNTPTGSNVRGSSTYRSHLVRVLTRRCLMTLRTNMAADTCNDPAARKLHAVCSANDEMAGEDA